MPRATRVDTLEGIRGTIRIGDEVVVYWGGIDRRTGSERTTSGVIIGLLSDGRIELSRRGKRNCKTDYQKFLGKVGE